MDRQPEERDSDKTENAHSEPSKPAEDSKQSKQDQSTSPFPKSKKYKAGSKNKNKKKWLWITLGVLIASGLAVGAYLYYDAQQNESNTQNQPAQQEQEETEQTPSELEPVTKLRYAYQQGKRTVVREYDVETEKKTDIFEFQAQRQLQGDDDSFQAPHQVPNVDQARDGRFVYIDSKGVWKTESDGSAVKRIINITANEDDAVGTRYELDPAIKEQPDPGIFSVSNPQWSDGAEYLGFNLGFYESGAVKVFDISAGEYISATDTVRSIGETNLGEKFEISVDNQELKKTGLYPEYLVKPDREVNAATLSSNGQSIYAVLCPANKPDTGHSKYLPEAEPMHSRDCGEPADSELIVIDVTTGQYEPFASGPYVSSLGNYRLIESNGRVLTQTTADNGYKIDIVNPSNGNTKEFDPLAVAEISTDSVEAVRLVHAASPVAEIYYQEEDKAMVAVVHIAQEQILGSFWIDPNGAFTVLGVE